jgi:hypothetical protein
VIASCWLFVITTKGTVDSYDDSHLTCLARESVLVVMKQWKSKLSAGVLHQLVEMHAGGGSVKVQIGND